MMIRPRFLLLAFSFFTASHCFVGAAPTGATPPAAPIDNRPATMDELWDKSTLIIYGRIVALEVVSLPNRKDSYQAVLRVERCWKGKLEGEIIIRDALPETASATTTLQFNKTYVVQLTKSDKKQVFTLDGAQDFSLQPESGTGLFKNVDGRPNLLWVEFLERKAGNTVDADQIKELRGQNGVDRQVKASKAEIAAKIAEAQYRKAMEETGIAERKALLEDILNSIKYSEDKELVPLLTKINAEISVATTYLASGLKKYPQ